MFLQPQALEILVLQLPLPEVGRLQEKNEVSAGRPDPREQTRGRGSQVSLRQLHTAGTWGYWVLGSMCSCQECRPQMGTSRVGWHRTKSQELYSVFISMPLSLPTPIHRGQ